MRAFFDRLSAETRLTVLNPGEWDSRTAPATSTLEDWAEDVLAVLDAQGIERATLFGAGDSANACVLTAATYPERVERLVLHSPFARRVRSGDYPAGTPEDELLAFLRAVRGRWGDRDFLVELAMQINPEWADDEEYLDWFVSNHRQSSSPASAAEYWRMQIGTDITDVLGSIRVPTLVTSSSRRPGGGGIRQQADHGRHPDRDARRKRQPRERFRRRRRVGVRARRGRGRGAGHGSGDAPVHRPRRLDRACRRARRPALARRARSTPCGGSTRSRPPPRRGDRQCRRRVLLPFRWAARAIACAREILASAPALGLGVRAGIHTGECEISASKPVGLAVVIGARVGAACRNRRDTCVADRQRPGRGLRPHFRRRGAP